MKFQSLFSKQLTAFFVLFGLALPMFAVSPVRAESRAKLTQNQKVLHLLNRIGFGPTNKDIDLVNRIGIKRYIDRQLNASNEMDRELIAALDRYPILEMSTEDIFKKYPNPGALLRRLSGGRQAQAQMQNDSMSEMEQQQARRQRRSQLREIYRKYNLRPANQIMQEVQSARILRAVNSDNQLEEVMVDFWANHFNVYSRKAATRWHIPSYERDVIRKHALGNFGDLVRGTAMHPAMLFYLDNFQSVAPQTQNRRNRNRFSRFIKNGKLDPRVRQRLKNRGLTDAQIDQRVRNAQRGGNNQQRGINENYARELMELHTLGVDGGYTANDIKEVARAFTGWTIYDPRGYRNAAANMIQERENRQLQRQRRNLGIGANVRSGEFVFASRLHDSKPKKVLGQTVNEGGMKDGLKVIDILVNHESTSKHIARKLAVKFVNDEPSEELVNKVAKSFRKSGGDIKVTLRTLFESDEFWAPENYRKKIKTPFELLASSLRALDADIRNTRPLVALLTRMGEPLYGYQAPTGYPDTAVDWVNTGALLERMNFAVALASNRLPRTSVDLGRFKGSSKREILDKSIDGLLHGEISTSTKSTLQKQIEQPLPDVKLDDGSEEDIFMENRRGRNRVARLQEPKGDPDVFKVVGLILGSPEFQRQ